MPQQRWFAQYLITAFMAGVLSAFVPSAAQDRLAGAETGPLDASRFISLAYSSAQLQERASVLATQRDTRPEIKVFASKMKEFRMQQLQRLRTLASERGLVLSEVTSPYKVLLENLEPLDYLAFSRRYAELEIQALEQEIRGYERVERDANNPLAQFVAEFLPRLREWLPAARQMQDTVKP
jgi:predicted outer membrane protein